MKVVDANVLIYAVNGDTQHHAASRAWLDRALSGGDTVGFTWVALLAFTRLCTKHGLFPRPLTPDEALEQVDGWLSAETAHLVHPGAEHARTLERLLDDAGGNLVNDAHLAAIALQHRADVVTYDRDFARFPGVRQHRPEDLLG